MAANSKSKSGSNNKRSDNGGKKNSENGDKGANTKIIASKVNLGPHKPASIVGPPLLICVVVGVISLVAGIFSPPLLQAWGGESAVPSSGSANSRILHSSASSDSAKPKQQPGDDIMSAGRENEYSCDPEALSQVLHENPVPGLHVLCMNQTTQSLKLTLFPGAQLNSNPPQIEMEGLPAWSAFKQTLVESFRLRPMDSLHQPWAVFSRDGELLCKEDNDHVRMEGLAGMGMALIYQGGQFLWPGVKIGFKRTIQLYTIMPSGSPSISNKARNATLETLSLEPLVFAVEGFLDPMECDFFQEEALPTLKYSAVTLMDRDKGRPASDFRTSQSTFLSNDKHPIVEDIDYRTASLVRVPRFHQEKVQVLRYGGGEKYDAHHDYFDKSLYQNDISTLRDFIQYGRRNRMITVFWYLSDVEEGGETIFPRFGGAPPPRSMASCDVGLKVKPARGKVIIFYSLKADGSMDPLSLHGACPVKKGVKWAANKWVWNLPIEFGSGK